MFELNEEQKKRLLNFCGMSDLELYERSLADLTLEEQAAFMDEFPEFLSGEEVGKDMGFKDDELFQRVLETIKRGVN